MLALRWLSALCGHRTCGTMGALGATFSTTGFFFCFWCVSCNKSSHVLASPVYSTVPAKIRPVSMGKYRVKTSNWGAAVLHRRVPERKKFFFWCHTSLKKLPFALFPLFIAKTKQHRTCQNATLTSKCDVKMRHPTLLPYFRGFTSEPSEIR